jgi:hypothetical protein
MRKISPNRLIDATLAAFFVCFHSHGWKALAKEDFALLGYAYGETLLKRDVGSKELIDLQVRAAVPWLGEPPWRSRAAPYL